jgi:hypothetical protein
MMISLETSKKTLEESEGSTEILSNLQVMEYYQSGSDYKIFANPRMSEISGSWSLDEILESNYIDFIHPMILLKPGTVFNTVECR